MLQNEVKWETSQQAYPKTFARNFEEFCLHPRRKPTLRLAQDVHDTRQSLLDWFSGEPDYLNPWYMLARHWGVFEVDGKWDTYPLWLHFNDVPTMRAAWTQDQALCAYLQACTTKNRWSSSYIAADLRIDVWAARVCLDLCGVPTPSTGDRPSVRPRAEWTYVHDGEAIQRLLREGYTKREVATELGLTEGFLLGQWKILGIDPETNFTPRSVNSDMHETWLKELRVGVERGGEELSRVRTVTEAAAVWGITFNGAKKRLRALGWEPYNSVDMVTYPKVVTE
jgi:hypothetical protein